MRLGFAVSTVERGRAGFLGSFLGPQDLVWGFRVSGWAVRVSRFRAGACLGLIP